MNAIQYTEHSTDVNVLKMVEVPKPTARPGYVVVKVAAAAANPIDSKVMAGYLNGAWAVPLPFSMGYDFAGVVSEVSPEDAGKPFATGDEVFAVNWGKNKHDDGDEPLGGAFAEYILMPVGKLSKKPAGLSFEQAAAVALVGTTAHQILFHCAKVEAGQRILVLGGSSAVGTIAIQLAKARGAWVATTCSTRNVSYVQQLGAPDKIVDYKSAKWEEDAELRNLDAVIDTIGEADGFAKATANNVVRPEGGAFVSISNMEAGFDPAGHPPLAFAAFFCLFNSVAVQDELAALMASGALKLPINRTFPFTLAGVREMMSVQAAGASNGKNVLKFE